MARRLLYYFAALIPRAA